MRTEVDPGLAAERAYKVARERARRAEERFFRGHKDDLEAAHAEYIAALRDELAAREAWDRIRARLRAERLPSHADHHAGMSQQSSSQPA